MWSAIPGNSFRGYIAETVQEMKCQRQRDKTSTGEVKGFKVGKAGGLGKGYRNLDTWPSEFFKNLTLNFVHFDGLMIAMWFPVVSQYPS